MVLSQCFVALQTLVQIGNLPAVGKKHYLTYKEMGYQAVWLPCSREEGLERERGRGGGGV